MELNSLSYRQGPAHKSKGFMCPNWDWASQVVKLTRAHSEMECMCDVVFHFSLARKPREGIMNLFPLPIPPIFAISDRENNTPAFPNETKPWKGISRTFFMSKILSIHRHNRYFQMLRTGGFFFHRMYLHQNLATVTIHQSCMDTNRNM